MCSAPLVDTLFSSWRERAAYDALVMRGGDTWTFGQWEQRARRWAGALAALDVARGDRVVCIVGTRLDLAAMCMGAYMVGAIHVPVNTRYGHAEIGHILRDSGATVAIIEDPATLAVVDRLVEDNAQIADSLAHVVPVDTDESELRSSYDQLCREHEPWRGAARIEDDEQAAMCIYTSGTTGRSKGVILSYRAIVSGIEALTTLWRFEPRDRLVLALPLFHIHGLGIGLHGVMITGCVAELHRGFDEAQVIEAMAEGASIFMGVPTMYTRLVRALQKDPDRAREAMGGARLYTSGSAALSAEVFDAFEVLTGHRILERYGMSETMLTVSNPYEPALRRRGTIGHPVPGCEVRVVGDHGEVCEAGGEVGQIAVRGPTLMSGYWGRPEATRASFDDQGWFQTGDAARYDERGYIVHMGRRSVDIIKSGGYKISTREIEEAIASKQGVREVAVVGIADEEWGQIIGAAIVPEPGAPRRNEAQWIAWLGDQIKDEIADYKRPRRVVLLKELPANALGKIQKHLISFDQDWSAQ